MEQPLRIKEDTPNYVHWPLPRSIDPAPECERFTLRDELATTGENPDWSEVDALMPTPAVDYYALWRKSRAEYLAEKAAAEKEDPKGKLLGYDYWWRTPEERMQQYLAPPTPRVEVRGPILIEALVPGAGKTYLVKRWLERTNQKETSLIVCPWNALVTDCIKDGFNSLTLHQLVGKLAVEDHLAKIEKRAHNVDEITHVHFEELYLYTARELSWVKNFMNKHKTISFSAAGDPGQLEPVNQNLAVDSDAWYESAFAQMFPRRLTLQVSKRCSGDDRERMRALCDNLRNEQKKVVTTLRAAKLREVNFENLTEEDAQYPQIAAMRSTVARVDHWVHTVIGDSPHGEYEAGQTLLGVDGCRCKGGRICSNMSYTVDEVTETHLTVKAPDGSTRTLTLDAASSFLKRPYCMTGHATQGLSLGARIYVHDWKSDMATHRWIRTVMSRCGTLDIVLVNGSEGARCHWIDINKRIAGHILADKEKQFPWNSEHYITAEWVKKQLRSQRWSCWTCAEPLDQDWSVDRISNDLPHLRDNCALACRYCQNGSSHRPTFKPTPKIDPVVEVEAAPIKAQPKVVYNFTPSTYENRPDWHGEPCALRKKKCKGGLECHHCGGTARGEWRNSVIEREDAAMAMY